MSQLIVKTEEIDTYKSTHSLNLLLLNTHSISAKKVSFGNLISEYNPDIIAVHENWFKPDDLSYVPAGYNAFRKDRPEDYRLLLILLVLCDIMNSKY